MIKLTRLNGSDIFLNEDLIEIIEATPDTVITLNNGNRYLAAEPIPEILDRIIEFKASVRRRAEGRMHSGADGATTG
ncbi:MAG: flagellar FlbD family protein [Deltaproteobacteria bacterium]|nr:flagellar FlbD family protein [Deltaproteobacteria bacterium]